MNNTSLLNLVRESFEKHSDLPVVIVAGENVSEATFSQVWERATSFVPIICRYFSPDQVVPIYVARCADCLSIMLACVMAGRAFSVLNNRIQVPQLRHILEQTRSRAIFADGSIARLLNKSENSRLDFLIGVDILLLKNESWMPIYDKQLGKVRDDLIFQTLSADAFSDLGSRPDLGQTSTPSPDRPAACLFTSGSTGRPKGVLVSDSDLVSRALAEIECFGITSSDRLLNILPWSFDVGLSQVLTSWASGCPLVVLNSWLPKDVVEAAVRFSITGLSAVPSIWIDFLASGLAFEPPFPRYVTISGGSLSAGDQAKLVGCLAATRVIKTYGQTETCRSSVALPETMEAAPQSLGYAYIGARIYVVDEMLCALPPDSIGEIVHTGNGTMLGYLDDSHGEKLIKNPFYAPDGDSALVAVRTGDFGYLDAEGRLYLLGRRDDMVKIHGNRIFLAEVVTQVEALSDVQEAVVLHSEEDVPELLLFVTLFSTDAERNPAALKKQLASRLPAYMIPSRIWILDAFPRAASGKPDRVALKAMSTNTISLESE